MFLVCLALVPLFVWYVREKGDAWVINAVVSTVAFPFWAYALGATAFSDHWDGNLAAITLATFTVVSGLIAPRMHQPKREERTVSAPPRTERVRSSIWSARARHSHPPGHSGHRQAPNRIVACHLEHTFR